MPVGVHVRVVPDDVLTMSNLWAPPVAAFETASTVYEFAVDAVTETEPPVVPYDRPVVPSFVASLQAV